MDCPVCKNLERTFESKCGSYIAARSAAYYRVSTELAAYTNVEMERAKSNFEEHRLVCKASDGIRSTIVLSCVLAIESGYSGTVVNSSIDVQDCADPALAEEGVPWQVNAEIQTGVGR